MFRAALRPLDGVKEFNSNLTKTQNLVRVFIGTFSFWLSRLSHSLAWAEGKREENEYVV